MSVASCTDFLQQAFDSPDLRQRLKAITGTPEIVALGGRHGYEFDVGELATASSSFRHPAAAGPGTRPPSPTPARTAFYHYEFELAATPGLAAVAGELPNLTIQPPTVDLAGFDAGFREGDLRSLDRAPTGPVFERLYRELQDEATRPGANRRDFHLVNLDEQVGHPGYPDYFAAKTRVIVCPRGVLRRGGALLREPVVPAAKLPALAHQRDAARMAHVRRGPGR